MTEKQEKFALCIVSGMNQTDAYKTAYPDTKMTNAQIYVEASRLANEHPKVSLRIKELREKVTNSSEEIMSARERLIFLSQTVKGKQGNISDKLKAIDLMNKMQGEYVQKVDSNNTVTINVSTNADVDEESN